MKVLVALLLNLIFTLLVEIYLLCVDGIPLKDYKKEMIEDIGYMILIYMTFNFGYLIQNIFNIR